MPVALGAGAWRKESVNVVVALWPEPKLNAGEAELVVVPAGIASCDAMLDPNV
jgi:hypothetical protein